MKIRFDNGPDSAAAVFCDPHYFIETMDPGQVTAKLAELDAARDEGYWLAGYCSYELGYALEPRLEPLMPSERQLPLLRFGVYDAPVEAEPLQPSGALGTFEPVWSAGDYAGAFDRVNGWIGAGDIYQANLTFPMWAKTEGEAFGIYSALAARQAVTHGALVEQLGWPDILCRSPELFFRLRENGEIETRPMKGTQPRSDDPEEDAALIRFLANDPKNRAENLMIVDLLRNDISRVAEEGSVHVPELFHVETYSTVHQMTSLVRARLREGAGLADVFEALFPCGSITGAPKLRSMQIIRELESAARDIYCGSIGWAAPDGRAVFNVAIRSLLLDQGNARLNVGGGVVWDSTAASEYEEALWKARFAKI